MKYPSSKDVECDSCGTVDVPLNEYDADRAQGGPFMFCDFCYDSDGASLVLYRHNHRDSSAVMRLILRLANHFEKRLDNMQKP